MSVEVPEDAFDRPAFTTFYGVGDADIEQPDR
jgi:hypothetical protein